MDRKRNVYIISIMFLITLLTTYYINNNSNNILMENNKKNIKEEPKNSIGYIEQPKEEKKVVYENMTIEELSIQIEKSMNSSIEGYGYLFAEYAVEKKVDPYLATAIALHETGCKWTCSSLVRNNNNVGGQKASNGKYQKFNSLEEGIKRFIDNLANNYYAYGYTTPQTMNKKYAASTTWATKVNNYMKEIRNK